MNFSNQVVVVTGAGSKRGLGNAIASYFAKRGAKVVLADIDYRGASDNAQEIMDRGGIAYAVELDVTSEVSVQQMIDQTTEMYGRLDVLVNNAGISQAVQVKDMSTESFRKILEINVIGTFLCSKAVLPIMKRQQYGRIVNLSSAAGKMGGGFFGGAHYAASKAGVLGFSKCLAREVIKEGITVNSVCPGLIDTDIWKSLEKEKADALLASLPMGRPGTPLEVAATIAFLASKDASYITGEEVDINGGVLMD